MVCTDCFKGENINFQVYGYSTCKSCGATMDEMKAFIKAWNKKNDKEVKTYSEFLYYRDAIDVKVINES